MGASMSLAIFAALVAAITVVASMTVIGAVGLLFYSAAKQEQEELLIPPNLSGMRNQMPMHLPPPQSSTFQGQQRLNMIDARHLVGYFEEDEESSLAHFNASQKSLGSPALPPMQRETPNQDGNAAYGTPEWTEEEGATEIFSANNAGDLSDFGLIEEEPTRIAATTAAATRAR
jgi:hypothetical protein